MGGAIWEEWERSRGRLPRSLVPWEPPEIPGPLQVVWVLGAIGERLGRSGEAGRRGPPRAEEQERRAFARPT